jgi:hypothetical protein
MASLIPEIDAFQGAQTFNLRQQMGQMQQLSELQKIMAVQAATQQREGALMREKQLRGVLSSLPPDATSDDVIKAIRPYASPDDLLKFELGTRQKAEKTQNPSNLSRLMAERDAMPTDDPRRKHYDNAIRKESETARQIAPPNVTVQNPAPVSTIVVKDPSSSTGWSYKDARTGRVTSQDAPPPAADPNRTYDNTTARESGKDDVEQFNTAVSAKADLTKIKGLVKELETSQAITGLGAGILKNVERAKVLLANDKKAGKVVSDTEYLDALMGSEVFSMIKPLGIGARGLDTPAERQFLRQVMTGDIALNKETLLKMAKMRQDITERSINRWNTRVKKGELDRFFSATGRTKEEIPSDIQPAAPGPAPAAPAPASGSGKWSIKPL